MMAAGPLHRAAGLRSIVATSYQSVSGSGQQGVVELVEQTDLLRTDLDALMTGGSADPRPSLYARPIGFNVLPVAGSVTSPVTPTRVEAGERVEEDPRPAGLHVEPTCVRVPVLVGHGVVASLRFERPIEPDEAYEILETAPGVQLVDDVPTPLDSADRRRVGGSDPPDCGSPGWHQPLGGRRRSAQRTALNAVQIAELLSLGSFTIGPSFSE